MSEDLFQAFFSCRVFFQLKIALSQVNPHSDTVFAEYTEFPSESIFVLMDFKYISNAWYIRLELILLLEVK